jgi:hypothetical protein
MKRTSASSRAPHPLDRQTSPRSRMGWELRTRPQIADRPQQAVGHSGGCRRHRAVAPDAGPVRDRGAAAPARHHGGHGSRGPRRGGSCRASSGRASTEPCPRRSRGTAGEPARPAAGRPPGLPIRGIRAPPGRGPSARRTAAPSGTSARAACPEPGRLRPLPEVAVHVQDHVRRPRRRAPRGDLPGGVERSDPVVPAVCRRRSSRRTPWGLAAGGEQAQVAGAVGPVTVALNETDFAPTGTGSPVRPR